ncbi:MAG: hypothetical protein U0T32_10695 [Chitinophagales bacterium]
MKRILSIVFIFFALSSFAQTGGFDFKIPVRNVKGVVKKLNSELTVIELVKNENKRYIASNLPDEFKKDGLQVTFSGLEAPIPPYIRMAGTPIKLKSIKVTTKEMKSFKLTKKKYKL